MTLWVGTLILLKQALIKQEAHDTCMGSLYYNLIMYHLVAYGVTILLSEYTGPEAEEKKSWES